MIPVLEALPPKKFSEERKNDDVKTQDIVYTEEDLESSITISSDASYYEKAQDFRQIVKTLRIKYLGLKPLTRSDKDGNITTVYVRDSGKDIGINPEGVEMNIRFLETRLGKHIVLSNVSEQRMQEIILDDMNTWADIHEIEYDRFQMNPATLHEFRSLMSDLLEWVYRRPIENKEREMMRPNVAERLLRKAMGLGMDDENALLQGKYPQQLADLGKGKNYPNY